MTLFNRKHRFSFNHIFLTKTRTSDSTDIIGNGIASWMIERDTFNPKSDKLDNPLVHDCIVLTYT